MFVLTGPLLFSSSSTYISFLCQPTVTICNESVFPKVHTKLNRKILDNIPVFAFTQAFPIIYFCQVKCGCMQCTQQGTVGYNEGLLTEVVLNQKERISPHKPIQPIAVATSW